MCLKEGLIVEERSRLSKIRRRIGGVNAELQELMISLFSFSWGLMISLDQTNGDVLSRSPALNALTKIAPDHVWAGILISLGLFSFFSYSKNYFYMRRFSAMLNTFIYSLMAYLVWLHPLPVLGVVVIPITAIFSFLTLLRQEGRVV